MSNDLKKKFEQVFDDYHRQLLFYALRFVHDQNDAEDIVAEVFYDLWKRIDDIDLESGIATYLYRAVSSRALNHLRHKNVAAVRIELLGAINEKRLDFIDKNSVDDIVHSKDIGAGIREAIAELPDKCRQVFVLSYVNGLKSKDIADALDISVRTVDAHIYKALRLLRGRLKYLVTIFAVMWALA